MNGSWTHLHWVRVIMSQTGFGTVELRVHAALDPVMNGVRGGGGRKGQGDGNNQIIMSGHEYVLIDHPCSRSVSSVYVITSEMQTSPNGGADTRKW